MNIWILNGRMDTTAYYKTVNSVITVIVKPLISQTADGCIWRSLLKPMWTFDVSHSFAPALLVVCCCCCYLLSVLMFKLRESRSSAKIIIRYITWYILVVFSQHFQSGFEQESSLSSFYGLHRINNSSFNHLSFHQ